MMNTPVYIIDAFTSIPFGGNPAAVILPDKEPDSQWMQQMAGEMNLSETAFLWPENDGYRLKWFTPRCEVDLCGHATLAASHVLFSTDRIAPCSTIRFYTRSGILTATYHGKEIWLDFPATPPQACIPPPDILPESVRLVYCGQSCFDLILHVSDEKSVRELVPCISYWKTLPYRGIIVTAEADDMNSRYNFVSRFFAPAVGIDEDPVTGSAHCCLGPYFSTLLQKTHLIGKQLSLRGGIVKMVLNGNRIRIGGQAVTILAGTICCPGTGVR